MRRKGILDNEKNARSFPRALYHCHRALKPYAALRCDFAPRAFTSALAAGKNTTSE